MSKILDTFHKNGKMTPVNDKIAILSALQMEAALRGILAISPGTTIIEHSMSYPMVIGFIGPDEYQFINTVFGRDNK